MHKCFSLVYVSSHCNQLISIWKFVFSEKGKKLLVLNAFKYCFQKELAKEVQRWTCTDKKCKAFVKTDCRGTVINDEYMNDHNHEPLAADVLTKQRISNAVKRKAVEDPSEQPQKLIWRELDSTSLQWLDASDLVNLRHNLYRARRSRHPALPKTLQELHKSLATFHVLTKLGEDFLLVNDDDCNI